jgi:tetratricopeptide (TPR) repeat protein
MKNVIRCACIAAAGLIGIAARAGELADLSAAFAAHRYAEIDRLAAARLAEKPDDPAAAFALGRVIVEREDSARFKLAEEKLSACIEQHPEWAACHLWRGRVYGKQIDGMLSGLRLAPKVRAGFERAVELDPLDLDAQAALVEFYVTAPSALGGGLDKAAKQVDQAEALDAAGGKLLRVFLLIAPAELQQAESLLQGSVPSANPKYNVVRAYAYLRLGLAHFTAKRFAQAQRVFEAGVARDADDPRLLLMLGRSLVGQGRAADAVPVLMRSAASWLTATAEFRIGEAMALSGDTAGALAHYEAALRSAPALPPALRDEAQSRLKTLRSQAASGTR